jgi:hypothetical protein
MTDDRKSALVTAERAKVARFADLPDMTPEEAGRVERCAFSYLPRPPV